MPYVVTQPCCADASCVVACPVNCIHPAPGEPGFATAEMLYVDPAGCVDCGACVTACPVDAIKPHTKLAPNELPFLELNAGYYRQSPHADRSPVARLPRQRRLRSSRPVRVAIVGAGPAGLYVADELLKHPEVSVEVFERLMTPHGLVRAGVAPDHQRTKQASALFRHIEADSRFRYHLGVDVGRDVTRADLAACYDAVVWTVGAAADKTLGIPGEQLPGSLSATALVRWYNGHPDGRDLPVDLATERAVVVGNGNVALDVARVLTRDPEALAATDIAEHALNALRHSEIREVVVIGRRGPAQAAFTTPELIGLAGEPDVDVVVDTGGLPLPDDERGRVLHQLASRPSRPGNRRIVLRFGWSPLALLGTDRVSGVRLARTRLEVDAHGIPRATLTDETEDLPVGLVLRSVGYHGQPVADLPYDEVTGTVPNDAGRVAPGSYVAGWIKRGPTGFIGSNKTCAQETVASLLDDLDAEAITAPRRDPRLLLADLRARGITVLDREDWWAIEAEERAQGAAAGRVRRKLVDRGEAVRVAEQARADATRSRPGRRDYDNDGEFSGADRRTAGAVAAT
ncbi:FAD-dependent oxidoreductase [Calidifontibacter sp. DB0510]|uniref:ferredoxin--NADP(+) reductase n=1 Tax=Metallococcus carri TaxID=1656884 RepID=A0A967EAK3_9MICO|nr:FAD-dependent oxidoreductase [Metallococcus carri]NHN56355.1 FAD-dependent oxidoreductase [Metallococcus carri]NOP35979.1 FAD-dependent oxidoreductase [Calidifontibacter sp. DB2511S]